ncbi:hypothetical protein ABZZ20_19420 [Streptomyces sp. NPDC006430]|uniref:hypothetical protein n=1 Tax=Streptomyces sp. NPDC006430 TaxID=3154299 RepID=UPI0033BF4A09
MPIDPYAALNAMLRAEVTRYSPPAPKAPSRPADPDDGPVSSVATGACATSVAEVPSED